MPAATYPFRYYGFLPESTLTTKIREESWDLERLFPVFRQTKSELRQFSRNIKPEQSDIEQLQHSIAMLATEITKGIKDMKLINFCDSALFYLYFRMLYHALGLCEKEEARLRDEESKTAVPKSARPEEIRNAKRALQDKIKQYEIVIHGLGVGEKELRKAAAHLLNKLRKLKWKTEKQAQHEFSLSKITFRSLENLNRKIKVEAMKVKNIVPHKVFFMRRIQKKISSEDIVMLAKLLSESIDRVSKDVAYSSKLIADFEDEFERLKAVVERLKKSLNIKNITEPWDRAVIYVEKEIDRDLMQIFRNMFVEYKYISARMPKPA